MTVDEIIKKIECKKKELSDLPKLRKKLNNDVKELEKSLKLAQLSEVNEAIERANVTPKDVVAALDRGLIKTAAASVPDKPLSSDTADDS